MAVRHKFRQMSFLHIFHHATMVVLGDFAASRAPWPAVAFILLMNSWVHVPMYLYYGARALELRVPAWCKMGMTLLQLLQLLQLHQLHPQLVQLLPLLQLLQLL